MYDNESEGGAGGAGGEAGGAGGGGEPKTIPYERFETAVREKQELATEVSRLKTEAQQFAEKAATAGTLASELETWEAKAAEAEGRFGRYKSIGSALGTSDPDAIEAVEWQFGKLPEEGRPELDAWLTGLKEKPDDAPAVLRPWLKPADTTTTTTTRRQAVGGGGPGAGAGGAAITEAKIREVREKCVATGNWEPWKALKKRMNGETS